MGDGVRHNRRVLMTPTSVFVLVGVYLLFNIFYINKLRGGICMVYLAVGVAGIIGTLLRYYTGSFLHTWWYFNFPLGTWIINLIGCFVLSWFAFRMAHVKMPQWFRVGFGTGLIGSFTTFSTFSVETVDLFQKQFWWTAIAYVLLSLWGGIFMAWVGNRVAASQLRARGR